MLDPDRWLFHHLTAEAPRLFIGAGALVVASFVNFRTGAQLRSAIEAPPGESRKALTASLLLFGCGAAAGCIRTFIFDSTAERIRAKLAAEVFVARLRAEPAAQAESGATPSAVATFDSDVAKCAEAVTKLKDVVRFTSSVVGGTAAMFMASWKLSAAVWPLLVTGSLHGARAGAKQAGKSAQRLAAARDDALGFAEERLQHTDLVRWFSRAETEAEAFREKCEACVTVAAKAARGRGIAHLIFDFITKGVLLGLCHLGSRLVQRGEITAGELTSFFFHATFLGLGLYGLVGLVPEIAGARGAAKRLAMTIDLAGSSKTGEGAPQVASTEPLSVSFQAVSFGYPSSERNILQGFSLEVPAGSTCALVGPSGCGKSTAVSLLLRDHDPKAGKILLGGKDISGMPRDGLRGSIGVSPQQPALLGSSLLEAIKFGVPPWGAATQSDVEAAAKRACMHGFASSRPGGYDAPVGGGGSLLSGGERQRVSLARALVRGAPVLILDEPTSALDPATAKELSEAILGKRSGRPTTLVVTHSLAVIRACDNVAVLSEDGQIVQQGSFAKIAAEASGPFAKILKAGVIEDDTKK
mmetsp:Transcript_34654/g.102970  ORF Transcript_34654/g.102970 Transcript_34654/m.102970 type:complete len:584 (-) Transcript_34654:107-1858(-)